MGAGAYPCGGNQTLMILSKSVVFITCAWILSMSAHFECCFKLAIMAKIYYYVIQRAGRLVFSVTVSDRVVPFWHLYNINVCLSIYF